MDILLTSVGRRSYMVKYFKDALSNQGKVHVSNSFKTYAFEIADYSIISPLIYEDNYIEFILNYVKKNQIKAIISLFDIDLPILAKNKKRFAQEGIEIIVSDYDFVEICNDKWKTYHFLKNNSFYTPTTFLKIEEAIKAIKNKLIHYPLIIKPRFGMGSIGIYQADNILELEVFYKKTQREIDHTYLKYESIQTPNESIIIQEKISGEEYGLDIFNDLKGNHLVSIPKRKLAMRSGETDGAEILEDEQLLKIGKQVAEVTMHIGNLDLDCFLWKNEFYILEMNCRFGGQYPFCHLAGTDFPKAIVQMLQKEEVSLSYLKARNHSIGFKDITPVLITSNH